MSEYSIGKQGDGTSYEPVIRQVENTINNALKDYEYTTLGTR